MKKQLKYKSPFAVPETICPVVKRAANVKNDFVTSLRFGKSLLFDTNVPTIQKTGRPPQT